MLAVVLLVAYLGPIFYLPFHVPTTAMSPTLDAGDQILVRSTKPSELPRGQIVAFRYPVDPKQISTKRIVAIPGDRVRFKNKVLYLNGSAQNEPYASHQTDYVDSYTGVSLQPPTSSVFLRSSILQPNCPNQIV